MHKNDDWFDDMSSRVNYHAEYVPADNNRLHVNSPMWNNSIIHATHTSGNEQSRTFYYLSEKAKGWMEAHSFYDSGDPKWQMKTWKKCKLFIMQKQE